MLAVAAAAETMLAALFAIDDPRFASIVVEAREAALRMLDALTRQNRRPETVGLCDAQNAETKPAKVLI